jgi:hypothetical protein
MSMKLAIIGSRIRRVLEVVSTEGDAVRIRVVTGHHNRRVTSGRHPGAGFRQIPGEKNRWIKRVPQIHTISVSRDAVFTVDDWPVYPLEELTPDVRGKYEELLGVRVSAALSSSAASAFLRKPPHIHMATVENEVKAEGLPMLEQNDLTVLTRAAWENVRPNSRKRRGDNRIAVMAKEAIEADKEAEKQAEREQRLERERRAIQRAQLADRAAELDTRLQTAVQRGWPEEAYGNVTDLDTTGGWGHTLQYMSAFDFNRDKHAPDGWIPGGAIEIPNAIDGVAIDEDGFNEISPAVAVEE